MGKGYQPKLGHRTMDEMNRHTQKVPEREENQSCLRDRGSNYNCIRNAGSALVETTKTNQSVKHHLPRGMLGVEAGGASIYLRLLAGSTGQT